MQLCFGWHNDATLAIEIITNLKGQYHENDFKIKSGSINSDDQHQYVRNQR
jgi:hypothetical protein